MPSAECRVQSAECRVLSAVLGTRSNARRCHPERAVRRPKDHVCLMKLVNQWRPDPSIAALLQDDIGFRFDDAASPERIARPIESCTKKARSDNCRTEQVLHSSQFLDYDHDFIQTKHVVNGESGEFVVGKFPTQDVVFYSPSSSASAVSSFVSLSSASSFD